MMSFTFRTLRSGLVLVIVFCTVLILIRAQPYDDNELRDLLLPPGCPAPCFMGIRPGVTTVDEAVQILEESGWVENLDQTQDKLFWIWNGKESPLLGGRSTGTITMSKEEMSGYSSRIVTAIRLDTAIAFGRMYLLLGDNQNNERYAINQLGADERILAYYPNLSLIIDTYIQCSKTVYGYWNQNVEFHFSLVAHDHITAICR